MTSFELPRARPVTERPAPVDPPCWHHPEWSERHPWLVQGCTGRGDDDDFDLSPFGAAPAGAVVQRWAELRRALGVAASVHAPQRHETGIRSHSETGGGLHLVEPCDGHVTRHPDVLLAVATADCVAITLVAPRERAVAVLHAGWRGVAGGMARAGVGAMRDRLGVQAHDLEAHLGPAICGACYEVGPEVHEALGLEVPPRNTPVDLRRVLVRDLVAEGLRPAAVTASTWCTRCGGSPFFSHRAGHAGRQMTFAAVRR